LKGFSTRTLSIRLRELEKGSILERHRYNEIPPRVELVESKSINNVY
jgi:DNA-binding HxlR family transcriptional regulator